MAENGVFLVAMLGCGAGTLLSVAWCFSKGLIEPGENINTNSEIELSADILSLLEMKLY